MAADQGEGRRWSARGSGVLLALPMAGSGQPAQACRPTVGLTVKKCPWAPLKPGGVFGKLGMGYIYWEPPCGSP